MERSLCIHDEILLEAPIEATAEAAPILKEANGGSRKDPIEDCPY
jgi:DNA polymerase I-like protein with 3'-5' exonuclease and polymerase domains